MKKHGNSLTLIVNYSIKKNESGRTPLIFILKVAVDDRALTFILPVNRSTVIISVRYIRG